MIEFSDEVMEALNEKRVGTFVYIDLEFFPVRVHTGQDTVKWNRHKWKGLGGLLKAQHISRPLTPGKPMLEADVSLPLDRKLGEALTNGYYVNRKLVINVCALTEDGNVLERISIQEMNVIDFSSKDAVIVTFHAEDTLFDRTSDPVADPEQEKEEIYKEGVRNRFRQNVLGVLASSTKGDTMEAINSWLFGPYAFLANTVNSSLIRLGRLMLQRWRARMIWYTFETDPLLYALYFRGRWRKYLRGRIRAYTERGAVQKIHKRVRKNIWRFPRGYRSTTLRLNGKLIPRLIDLEYYRELDDPVRRANTDPIGRWREPTDRENGSEKPTKPAVSD